jgi:hypothetical protein
MRIVIYIFLIGFFVSNLYAQEKTKLDDFLISIKLTKNKVELKCEEGCKWKELSYSVSKNKEQLIDNWGMAQSKNDKNSKFLFTIKINGTSVILKRTKGTTWADLNFTSNIGDITKINRNGIVSK